MYRIDVIWEHIQQIIFVTIATILLLLLLGLCPSAWAQGEQIIFSAMGDQPYGADEFDYVQQLMADHNRYSPSEFLVFVGDIKAHNEPCTAARYTISADLYKQAKVPFFVVPGDNEWTDCSNPDNAWSQYAPLFLNFENNFCHRLSVEHQSGRPENFAFVSKGVLFIGINLVGGGGHPVTSVQNQILQDDIAWVSEHLQAHVSQVRAAVVFGHAGPGSFRDTFFSAFATMGASFGKPILYINGDTHAFKQENNFLSQPNMTRIVVANGSEQPLQVTVTTAASPFQLQRNPWTGSSSIVNMPPCVKAGPNQTLTEVFAASLNGQADDDGDPQTPGTLAYAWSKVSGPGTANFSNPNSLTTTATFDAGGTYVLRLTADDGGLQSNDEVTVIIEQLTPTITSFNPTVGAPATEVTITGSNLIEVTSVIFNGTPSTNFVVDSNTQLRAVVPAGATTGKIIVANSIGSFESANNFIVPNLPAITSFTPSNGPAGIEVTITGTDFLTTSGVSFNGPASPSFAIDSDTQIRAIVPATATTGKIFVTNAVGLGSSANNFLVVKLPTISSFSPAHGPAGAEVTITGSNFSVVTSVTFNGIPQGGTASFTVDSPTQVRATIPVPPPGGTTIGKIGVANSAGLGLSANNFIFTSMPVISSFSPTDGSIGTVVILAGKFFTTTTAVAFNGVSASFTVVSDTVLRATAPASGTTGKIAVTNSIGTTPSANNFIVTTQPAVTSFTPGNGPFGAEITVRGNNFAAITEVKFSGVSSTGFTVDSPTQIRAIVPSGAATGKISVTNSAGTGQSAINFIVTVITSFVPSNGPIGSEVLINGTQFNGATGVNFNGVAAGFVIDSDTQIRATVPAGATTGKIAVVFAPGPAFTADDFIVTAEPAITSFSPIDGPLDTEVTVRGTGFLGTTSVTFNGILSTSFLVESDIQLRATVPAGATTGKITLSNSAGSGVSTNDFIVTAKPVITSFSPANDTAGAVVTITGSKFTAITSVTIGGTPATNFMVDSPSQIRVTIPAGAATGKTGVTNSAGTGLSANNFVVLGLPIISSLTPSNGVVGAEITISGSRFAAVSGVTFNGVAAANFTVDSETQIRATVPSSTTSGKIGVTNTVGIGLSANNFELTKIASFTPANGPAGAVITLTGTHFTNVTAVSFNGVAAANFTIDSATQLRATVPIGTTTGKIAVTIAAGTTSSANDFFVTKLPVISSFAPSDGPPGTTVTLTGANFTFITQVAFNGAPAQSFTVDSETQIRAVTPAGVTTGRITVTNSAGTGTSASDFVVTGVPSISSFAPLDGPIGTEVTINGANFTGATTVTFNNVATTTFAIESNTRIRAIAPVPPPGGTTTGKIRVINSAGTGTSANNFLVTQPPVISSFNPAIGIVGAEVTITGNNFLGTSGVSFNGAAAASFSIDSNTQVRAIIPDGASTGKIGVTNSAGTGFSGANFTVKPPPVISSFTPADGPTGTPVTIIGQYFTGLTAVSFNGIAASSFTFDSDTQIRAVVPVPPPGGTSTGKIHVTTADGTRLSTANFIVTKLPAITAFSPSSAPIGTEITITGNNFEVITGVNFNGIAAASFTVDSNTQIRAHVPVPPPGGTTTGKIGVSNSAGTGLSSNNFTVVVTPQITSFAPANGVTGTEVTIKGSNFIAVAQVAFNGVAASSFTVQSDTALRAIVPAAATPGKISVTNTSGTGQSANDFQVLTLSAFTPGDGPVGSEVTLTGTHFTSATGVKFNGVSATSFTADSDTQLRATVPAGATTGKIAVSNAAETVTSANDFIVTRVPVITSFSPADGPVNTEVTLAGSNFTRVTSVKFNGVAATSFTVNSDAQIHAHVPTGASIGKIIVTNSAGSDTSANNFIVTVAPVISAMTPGNGPVGAQITITGQNFQAITQVAFNGTAAVNFTVDSPVQLRATVPVGATTGKIRVTNSSGFGESGDDFIVTNVPAITSFTPSNGPIGAQVTITGNNFAGTANVTFNGIAASFEAESNTQLRAFVPAGAATGKIVVSNSAGTSTSADNFVVTSIPVIAAFAPTIGIVGNEITLTGANFIAITGVKFNVVPAASFTVDSPTQIRTVIPAGTSTGKIAVTNSAGEGQSTNDFEVFAFTSFTPATGPFGTEVIISGAELDEVSSVKINGIPPGGTSFTVDSKTQLRAVVSNGASTGKIVIATASGLSLTSANDFIVTFPPAITGFSPSDGPVGSVVIVTGTNFIGTSSVTFNNTAAASFTVVSDTEVRATVPTGAGNGKIAVINSAGTAMTTADFVVTDTPVITSFTPADGPPGTEVTIDGQNFFNVNAVAFNGIPPGGTVTFTVLSVNQIRTTVPASATTGKISVTNSVGTGLSAGNFIVTRSPSIFSFTPTIGAEGSMVTITGNNFDGASAVKFNNTASTNFTVNSNTQITAQVPAFATTGKISVTNSAGIAVSGGTFTVKPPPVISSFTPTQGPAGTEITINGLNFTGLTGVAFNGIPPSGTTSFVFVSDTRIRATIPAGATTGKISVSTVNGTRQSVGNMIVIQIPQIALLAPPDGPIGAAVNIVGSKFTGTTQISFNGVTDPGFTLVSDTLIQATVPGGATTGKISLTNAAGTGQSANDFIVTITPALTSFQPSNGPVGLEVTITGNNFAGASSVTFNGTPSSNFTVDSNTQIRATVPVGVPQGGSKIVVINSAGSAISTNDFIVTSLPLISSFTPGDGSPSTQITIVGDHFLFVSNVTFNSASGTNFTVDSPTQIRATIPSNATTGKLGVINSAGTGLSATDFVVTPLAGFTFNVLHDTYVRSSTPTTNNGTAASVRSETSTLTDRIYLKFNVTGLSAPVSNAKLRLLVTNGSVDGGSVYLVSNNYAGTTTPWTETGLLWNNAPAIGGAPVLVVGAVNNNATIDLNVTSAIAGNGSYSFAIQCGSTDRVQYSSKEGSSAPRLIIETLSGSGTFPMVTSFTPPDGPTGTPVTIAGSNFVHATSVTFNGIAATSFTIDSDTQIRATVPVAGTTGKIVIANSNGPGQSAVDFIVTKVPVITSFSPIDGPVGVEVIVTGSNFAAISGVTFNGVAAASFTVLSNTQLRATAPIGVPQGGSKIGITNSAGTGLSANDFIITKAPVLAAFTPSNGPVGSEVTITGDNFLGVSSVAFNGIAATNFIFDANAQLRATVPVGATTGNIVVANSAGVATSANDFIVTTVPVIASFTPVDGPVGTEVRISGHDFVLISGVTFNGIPLSGTSFTVDADTLLRATVPAGVTNGKIGVSNSAGTGLSGSNFIATETPVLTAFTPADGPISSQVTITGDNFLGVSSVKFNGVAATSFTIDSDAQIRATVPSGATTGKIIVKNSAGADTSNNSFIVTNVPVIFSFTPGDGPVATEVRIVGQNFIAITGVIFNGTAASFTVDADTLLRAPVPAGVTSIAKIIVRNSAGADTSTNSFIVTLTPVITSFAPLDGPEGAEVTLTGSRFLASTAVRFNGITATQFTVDSDTKLRVIVPGGATTNKISVTNSAGTGISATNFIVTKVPMITAFTPTDGSVGTEVAITGANFIAVTKVAFGEVNAASFAVDSPTKIRAGVPAGATIGKIAVTNSAGVGASLSNFIVTAVPNISVFTPANGPIGTEVTLTGSNFIAVSGITFNNVPATNFTVDSATQLRVQVPAGTPLGAGKIRVTNSAGIGISSNDFAVTAIPVITAFTPNDGPVSSEITLTGTNFIAIASVRLNGIAVTNFTVDSATQLRLTVPLDASTGRIIVTNSAGADTTASDFILTHVPAITSFTPPDGPVGTEVTITGRHFFLIAGVTFNGVAATNFTVAADTLIRATVSAGATVGKIGITNSAGTGFTGSNFIVTSGPGITSFAPPDGPIGAEIMITGANLLGASSVTFNGTTSGNFTVISNTQIRAQVPAGATNGKIGVVNSAGSAQSANDFIITRVPVIAAFTPDEGPVGTEIVITGNHFTATSSVKINGTAANNFVVNSDSVIRAHVPAGATTGRIAVANSAGADTSDNQFIVTAVPQIVSAIPADGPIGTAVVIKGRHFVRITQVTFNGVVAGFTVESDSLLRTTIPVGAATGKIGIKNSAGTGQSANNFIVTTIPVLASFSPNNGPVGAEVTINGTGLAGTSLVSFNGIAATSFTVDSDILLRATVPTGVPQGGSKIIVGNSAGADTSASNFTLTIVPAIASFTPADGPAGTEVKITGSNFLLITSVTFNGVNAASFAVDSPTQIRAAVPSGVPQGGIGKIKVTNSAGTGESANNFIATVLPVITSLAPDNGPVGAEIVINGTGFSGASQVSFNGVLDPTFAVESDTRIRAHVPAGSVAGKIMVKNSAGEGASANDFIVVYAPVITSFTPADGSAGARVTIIGQNFISTSQVTFNGVAATNVTVASATLLRATVAAGTTTGKIALTNAAGTGSSADDFVVIPPNNLSFAAVHDAYINSSQKTSNFGNNAALHQEIGNPTRRTYLKFEVTGLSAPVLSAKLRLFVTNASADGGSVYAVSNNYLNTSTPWIETGLNWNNAPTISGTPLSSAGAVVLNSFIELNVTAAVTGNGTFSFGLMNNNADRVEYSSSEGTQPPALILETVSGSGTLPTITSFAPANGPAGAEVTITGYNFTGVTSVSFNGVAATNVTVDSDTQIRATIPAGAITGKISITKSNGSGQSANDFVVTTTPLIAAFTPANGPPGTEVMITGNHFVAVTGVTFNGVPQGGTASFVVETNTQIRATVPVGATTGKIGVINSAGAGLSANDFIVTTIPVIASFTPSDGAIGAEVIITGVNFQGASQVIFNPASGTAAVNVTVVSPTQIHAAVPIGATTGKIIVINSAGSDTSANNFLVTTVPEILSFTPSNGPVGTEVRIRGLYFVAITGVTFNDTPAGSFVVESDTVLRAIVPIGAASGKLGVSNSAGTGFSIGNFIVPAVPQIASFAPPNGPAGAEITITGANLLGASSVNFNGTIADNFTVIANTQIRARVPAGATTGKISIANAIGFGQSSNNFIVTHIPVIASFAPDEGPVGTEIVIAGNHFTATSLVKINGTADNNFVVNADSLIRMHVPVGAKTGRIIVTNSAGADTSDHHFTVTATPQIVSLVPADGPIGAPVAIKGRNFVKITQVAFNGVVAGFTVESDSLLLTNVPAGATTGKIAITNSAGTGQSANDFIVTAIPVLTSFTPSNGPVGAEVTINGIGFAGISQVSFNGIAAASFTVDSDIRLRATVPSGATTGKIIVSNSAGADTSASNFTLTAVPAIASFTPADGPAGTEVTITGSNFLLITSVTLNNVSAAGFAVDSQTQLRAVVPAGATTGKIKITNSAGTGESANNFIVTVPPVIASFTPSNGPAGTQVTITGSGFVGVSQVSFNGIADPTFSVDSNTQIRAHVPDGVPQGGSKIAVANSAGADTSATDFVLVEGPLVTAFTPADGSAGTRVTITGRNFLTVSQVTFNGVAATGLTIISDTQLQATVPFGATTGKISVINTAGTGLSVNDFVVTPPTSLAFTAVHDAYVNSSQANSNFGNNAALHQEIGNPTKRAFLKFEVTGLSAPVLSAKLRLRVINASADGGAVYVVSNNYQGTSTPWIETGLNWNNAPAISGTPLSSAGAVAINSFIELNVTAAVAGNGTFSFGLMNNNTDRAEYSSSEGTQPPTLIIETVSSSGALPTITSFTPANGPAETEVTINGLNFTGATSGRFNGVVATNFTIDSDTQIRAAVPVPPPGGTTTGKIGVTNSTGTGFSTNDFVVTVPQFTLTANKAGSGNVALNPPGGTYDSGTVVTLTATPAAGFQFSGWNGDLSGSTNPATITMNTNKNVTATFTEISSGGLITHEENQTGGSSGLTTVASASLTGVNGHLYLAAVSSRPKRLVVSVSGLGLNWTFVQSICSGNNSSTGMDVWMAQGIPQGGSNGAVTATFASAPSTAVIAVSRYSGAAAANPIGNVIAGNSNGLNGACSGGVDGSAYSFNLATTADGAVIYGAAALKARTHAPGAGYTERVEFQHPHASNPIGVAVEDRNVTSASTVTVNGSFSGAVDWALVAVEIKPQGAAPVQHTLTVNAVGSGGVSLNSPGGSYDAGTVVTLTATPNAGFQFSGWSGDLNGSTNPAAITMNGNKNVTATFTALPPAQFTLTINKVGSGNVVLNPPGGSYDAGTVVTLTATPEAGFQFSGWSGDLSGSTNPATITMNANKNVTATFTEISSGGLITHEENQTGGSSGLTTVASASLTGVNGHLYLAAVSSRPKRLVVSVSGLGLNWTFVQSICSGNNSSTGMDVWMAQGIPQGGSNGTVTATFASAPSTAVIAVSRYSGAAAANPIGNVITGNSNGLNGACSGGVDGSAYSFNLATTADGAVVYGAAALKARTHAPGAGYTERVEFQHPHATNPIGVAVEDRNVASAAMGTVNGSFSGAVDWALVAVEIKPQSGSGPGQHALTTNKVGSGNVALNPSGGSYDAGTVVTLTATPDAGFQFSGWSGDLNGSTNPATITMNANKNVTATFTEISSGGLITHEENQTGGSSGSATVASASLTGVNGHLYLAAVSSRPKRLVVSVSGLGLNWTFVQSICSGNNSSTGMDVWMAQGIPQGGSNGAVTATFASAPSTAVIAVSRYSGAAAANPIGNVITGNSNGLNGACSGGVDGSTYSFNLATTADGAVVYGAAALKARTHAPGAGYTERVEFQHPHATNPIGVAVEDRNVASASTVTVNGSFSGAVDWALVAVEIKPPSGSGPAQHTLTVNKVGSGNVTLNPSDGSYDAGTVVTLTAMPDAGFQFSGWSGDLSGSTNPATITMNGNKNVTATFTALPPAQFTLTINKVGSGNVAPNPPGGSYDAGTVVTLTATPAAGFQFSGWSGDLSGSTNPATITMDGNKNVTATFTALPPAQFTLTINKVGSGNVAPNPPGGSYDAGTVVTLTATPAAGFQFSGWSGDLSGSTNPATITMDGNKNVTATFTTSGSTAQVVFEEIKTGGASGAATVTTSAGLVGINGHLYLAAVSTKPNISVASVSGLDLTWTRVRAQCAGRNQTGIEVWVAQGTPSGDGNVTATLAAAATNAAIAVSRYSGVAAENSIGSIVTGNTVGVDGACAGGVDNNAYSFDLTTTANGAMVYAAVAIRSKTHTPGTGYTERVEFLQGSANAAAAMAIADQNIVSASTVLIDGALNGGTDWAVVAVEIKPQASPALSKRASPQPETREPEQIESSFSERLTLHPNYPNPFNAQTTIAYTLPLEASVRLLIFNIYGQEVRRFVFGRQSGGNYRVIWDGKDKHGKVVPSSIYYYHLTVNKMILVRQMTVIK